MLIILTRRRNDICLWIIRHIYIHIWYHRTASPTTYFLKWSFLLLNQQDRPHRTSSRILDWQKEVWCSPHLDPTLTRFLRGRPMPIFIGTILSKTNSDARITMLTGYTNWALDQFMMITEHPSTTERLKKFSTSYQVTKSSRLRLGERWSTFGRFTSAFQRPWKTRIVKLYSGLWSSLTSVTWHRWAIISSPHTASSEKPLACHPQKDLFSTSTSGLKEK